MEFIAASSTHELPEQSAQRFNREEDLDGLVAQASRSHFVLIGEASHGTHEFYATRAMLTRRLIEEKGFRIIALEADWPDTLRVHRYVNNRGNDLSPSAALADFRRFPAWMWRNTVMIEFIEWLRYWNLLHEKEACGIFGLDLYSMHTSIEAVLHYLERTDPDAAHHARERYGCFEFFGQDPQAYGYATVRQGAESCEKAAIDQLVALRRKYGQLLAQDGQLAEDEFFYAEQNARLVANAERYYRSLFQGRNASWNLRDTHMVQTLEALKEHFGAGDPPKSIVWAHNSHLGDARATSMKKHREWNVGQLMREAHGNDVYSIGFSTYSGTVTAAREWGGPAERRRMRPALRGSYEALLHDLKIPAFWLDLRNDKEAAIALRKSRLQRAIGVIYFPETERSSHYFEASLPGQFDALIHLDQTRALEPLENTSQWDVGELPQTYPSAV